MFNKIARIRITGEEFRSNECIEYLKIRFGDYNDNLFKVRNISLLNRRFVRIYHPIELIDEFNKEEFDNRITWLLNYVKGKIPVFRQFGGDDIQLDIEYTLDLGNRQQRYVDNLSVDQMALMSTLGISYEISIWVNDEEE